MLVQKWIRAGKRQLVPIVTAFVLLAGSVIATQVAVSVPAFAGTDTYPSQWAPPVPQDSVFDSWGEYNRECTSYVAWMLHSVNGFEMPFHDNASGWVRDAQNDGYTVNTTAAAGAVGWMSIGHVAWIESVNTDGTVNAEDYNYSYNGTYQEHLNQPASTYQEYIHFKDLSGGGGSGGGTNPTHVESEASVVLNGVTHLFYYEAANGDLRHAWADSSGWHFQNLDGDSGSIAGQYGNYAANVGKSVSAVVYGSGIQLFYTAGNGALRHAWGNGTSWSFENLDGSSSSVSGSNNGPDGSSIASLVDSSGTLQVFYTIGNGDLRHTFSNSTGWHFENLDGDSGSIAGQAGESGSTVGASVTAVVYGATMQVFYNIGSNGDLRHAWADSSGWHFENLDGDANSIAGGSYQPDAGSTGIAAVVDAGNVLQVFYDAGASGTGYLRHAWSNTTGWHFENLDGDANSIAGGSYNSKVGGSVSVIMYGSSIDLFYQSMGSGDLRHVWADSNGWHFENLDGDVNSDAGGSYSQSVGSSVVTRIDGSGNLQVFYHSMSTQDLRHVYANSTGWHFENLDGDSGSIAGQQGSYGTNVG